MTHQHTPKESGYLTDIDDSIKGSEPSNCGKWFEDISSETVNLDDEANNFISGFVSNNVFYPDVRKHEEEFFSQTYNATFEEILRSTLDSQLDHENRTLFLHTLSGTPPRDRIKKSASEDLFKNYSEEEGTLNGSITKKKKPWNSATDVHENAVSELECTTKQNLISSIENCIIHFLTDLVSEGNAKLHLANFQDWGNCDFSNGILSLRKTEAVTRCINLKRLSSRFHFAMIFHVFSKVYHLLVTNTTCTERELFYDDPELIEKQSYVDSAIKDVCHILNTSAWELGICASSKGFIAGSVRIHMTNNLLIDCYTYDGAVLIPGNMSDVLSLETTAKFVLIVEKDTVFQKLVKCKLSLSLNKDIILITGRGYPDYSTRMIVKRLWDEFRLPIYTLVDADPFGIEIMFVYRFGSKAAMLNSDYLACPQIRWIGIHPSEIEMLAIPTIPQNDDDKKKLNGLLMRSYISNEIRCELEILSRLGCKAEIESITSFSMNFIDSCYIPNKIKKNLVI